MSYESDRRQVAVYYAGFLIAAAFALVCIVAAGVLFALHFSGCCR